MEKEEFNEYHKEHFFHNLVITGLLFVLLMVLITLFLILYENSINKNKLSFCGDGTLDMTCSLTKPYFCEEGMLIPKASKCGCPNNTLFNEDECLMNYFKFPEKRVLYYTLDGETYPINFRVYKGVLNYVSSISRVISYKGKPPSRKEVVLRDISDKIQEQALIPLVVKIENLDKDKNIQAKIAISLVQTIPYGSKNEQSLFKNKSVESYRYPYEVIYDNEGICEEKAELLIFLLKKLGFGTAFFYYPYENHAAVGIKCPVEKSFRNSGYCFVETTAPSIISAHQNNYIGSIVLENSPEIIPISDGISLSDDLEDYEDSEKWIYLNRLIKKNGFLNYFKSKEREHLIKKYNIGK